MVDSGLDKCATAPISQEVELSKAALHVCDKDRAVACLLYLHCLLQNCMKKKNVVYSHCRALSCWLCSCLRFAFPSMNSTFFFSCSNGESFGLQQFRGEVQIRCWACCTECLDFPFMLWLNGVKPHSSRSHFCTLLWAAFHHLHPGKQRWSTGFPHLLTPEHSSKGISMQHFSHTSMMMDS